MQQRSIEDSVCQSGIRGVVEAGEFVLACIQRMGT